jgi:hypothetical protein
MDLLLRYKVFLIGGIGIWLALATLTYLVLRLAGWAKLKQHAFTTLVLLLTVVGLPVWSVSDAVWSNRAMIKYRVWQTYFYHSPMILPSNGCTMLPASNIWNTPVNSLPLAAHSSDYVASIGPDAGLHADLGQRDGIPYTVVDSSAPMNEVVFEEREESDAGPYRIPSDAIIENGGDGHVLVMDMDACRLYELFGAKWTGRHWEAGAGAIFNLKSNALRPPDWTSTDAAGLPVLPGLIRYQEVVDGEIRHALRFTARRTQHDYVWPARHRASSIRDDKVPPMGQRFRLRQDFDISGFSPQAQVVLKALKIYGMMLADNGGNWYLTGAMDSRWDVRLIGELRKVKGASMEAVDVSSLMVDKDSGEARH